MLKRIKEFIFLCNPQKCLSCENNDTNTGTKNAVVCFYNLGEENF